MSIFKKTTNKKSEEKKLENNKVVSKDFSEKNVSQVVKKSLSTKLIRHPHLSEKAHDFMADNKYVFVVEKSANKFIVKREIENKYHVSVISVNIILNKGKLKMWRNKTSRREGLKKAIVTIKPGQKIEIT